MVPVAIVPLVSVGQRGLGRPVVANSYCGILSPSSRVAVRREANDRNRAPHRGGIAQVVSHSRSRGSLLVVIGLVLVPQWPAEWLEALKSTGHMTPPILRPGGLVALLALLRWRRPEARLIVALSCVPQSSHWYEVVPLLLVPATLLQSVAFSFSSSLPIIWEVHTGFGDGTFDLYPRSFQVALFAYLPAVIMVLRRPNVGELPGSGSSSSRR